MNGIVRCPYCGKEYVHQNCVNILCPCGAKYYSHNSQWLSRKPKTNADRIRAMSDEELVDALMTFLVKSVENSEFSKVKVEFEEGYRDALLEELRQPVKDGDTDG